MAATSIQWTDHSINTIRARDVRTGAVGHYCEKISSGCAHCYSSAFQKRFRMPGFPGKRSELPDGIEPFLDESKLQEVLRRKKPTKYFWCDMTDMFGWWVPDEWIDKCFAVMALTPQHTHQVLTKRPERMADYLSATDVASEVANGIAYFVPDRDWRKPVQKHGPSAAALYEGLEGGWRWPLPNVWLGVSVENQQQANERLPHLLRCPAAVRFVSAEPLLEAVDFNRSWKLHRGDGYRLNRNQYAAECPTRGIDWIIAGGESGHGARPCDLAWLRSIRDQCRAAGVAYFCKQLGSGAFCSQCRDADDLRRCSDCGRNVLALSDSKGGDIDEFPEDLRIRELPEEAA